MREKEEAKGEQGWAMPWFVGGGRGMVGEGNGDGNSTY